jgi:hypothetical protein
MGYKQEIKTLLVGIIGFALGVIASPSLNELGIRLSTVLFHAPPALTFYAVECDSTMLRLRIDNCGDKPAAISYAFVLVDNSDLSFVDSKKRRTRMSRTVSFNNLAPDVMERLRSGSETRYRVNWGLVALPTEKDFVLSRGVHDVTLYFQDPVPFKIGPPRLLPLSGFNCAITLMYGINLADTLSVTAVMLMNAY